MNLYFDYAATTKVCQEALEAIEKALKRSPKLGSSKWLGSFIIQYCKKHRNWLVMVEDKWHRSEQRIISIIEKFTAYKNWISFMQLSIEELFIPEAKNSLLKLLVCS